MPERSDLQTQVRGYCEYLDEMFPDVAPAEAWGARGVESLEPSARRRRGLVVAVAAAATTLLLIGGVIWALGWLPAVDSPVATTVPEPATTTVPPVTSTTVPPAPTSTEAATTTTPATTSTAAAPTTTTLPEEALALTEGWAAGSAGPTAGWESYFDPQARPVFHPDIGFLSIQLLGDDYGNPMGSVLWTSADGLDWTITESDLAADRPVVGGPGLVATTRECRGPDRLECRVVMWTSADGLTWNRVALDPAVFQGCEGTARGTCDVDIVLAAGERGLLAAGYDRGVMAEWDGQGEGTVAERLVIWGSDDGAAWTRSEIDLDPLGVHIPYVDRVVETPSGWLVVVTRFYAWEDGGEGIDSMLLLSDDGQDWERLDSGDTFVLASLTDVVSGPRGVVAIGAAGPCWDPAAWYSPDGRQWTRSDLAGDDWNCPVTMPDLRVVDTGTGYVAGMVEGRLWWSADGVEWHRVEVPEFARPGTSFGQLVYGDGNIVAFVWGVESPDGEENGVWVWPEDG